MPNASGEPRAAAATRQHDPVRWFHEHYVEAAGHIVDFLTEAGIPLTDKVVADVGCGDGVIDLGVFARGRPAQMNCYDVRPTDVAGLVRSLEAAGVGDSIPGEVHFIQSQPTHIPAEPDVFDIVFTWSTFEHVDDPVGVLTDIRRVLKPGGVLMLQLWPFFLSEHGGHLWQRYPEAFPHLLRAPADIEADLALQRGTDPTRPGDDEWRSLNRLRLDDLQRALLASGFAVSKAELMTDAVIIPPELMRYPLSDLLIGGIKLLATPR